MLTGSKVPEAEAKTNPHEAKANAYLAEAAAKCMRSGFMLRMCHQTACVDR